MIASETFKDLRWGLLVLVDLNNDLTAEVNEERGIIRS